MMPESTNLKTMHTLTILEMNDITGGSDKNPSGIDEPSWPASTEIQQQDLQDLLAYLAAQQREAEEQEWLRFIASMQQ